MKKLIRFEVWKEYVIDLSTVLNLCHDRPNCIECPLKISRPHGSFCLIPAYSDGDNIKSALNVMNADALKRKERARIRQRVLFDETK